MTRRCSKTRKEIFRLNQILIIIKWRTFHFSLNSTLNSIESYVPVINASNHYPVKAGKGHIFLYKIQSKFVKVPDAIQIRNTYNLNSNHCTSFCDIPIINTYYPIQYTIICDENRLPVEADDKHLLLVEKASGKTFRVADSPNVRKFYNLQYSSVKNVKNQMQPSTLIVKELQQPSSTMTNQAEHSILLNKQLQESSSIMKSQAPSLTFNLLKLPSTVTSYVQSRASTDKQYSQPSFISNPTESNVLNTNELQPYETVPPHNNNNASGSQVQVILSKTKRRKTNADTPRDI
ncbi:uncharacterized protein LOC118645009 [Monomorium pharaonis]|uniref:uncharacterized protein LOC118645009 n=1 Tax=Monomorium pharaonis TaxID=307658 RepID=UPI001746E2A5|nr:uncharacterized protein LOC118645009 [Monomorium pharaonis]